MEANVLHQIFASAGLAGMDPPVVQVKISTVYNKHINKKKP